MMGGRSSTTRGATLRNAIVALAALGAAACATKPDESVRPGAQKPETVTNAINLSGYPPEFRRGFSAGCAVARGGEGSRPKGDSQFAVGWSDGFDYCKPRK
jgi:hypothetical protein